jgi:hypothetical protein
MAAITISSIINSNIIIRSPQNVVNHNNLIELASARQFNCYEGVFAAAHQNVSCSALRHFDCSHAKHLWIDL